MHQCSYLDIAVSLVVSWEKERLQCIIEQESDKEEEDDEQVNWSKQRAYSSRVERPANTRWPVGSRL